MSAEKKIIIILVCSVALLELATRLAEPYLSKDLAHIRSFPSLAERLAPTSRSNSAEVRKVLVLGNSLARCGIDEASLREGLSEDDMPAIITFMTPDGTGVAEWAWGYRRYILNCGARPDLVIVMTGRGHLLEQEQASAELQRLAAFYVDASDRRQFLIEKHVGVEASLDFLVASQSRLAADRSRLRPLLFYNAVPGYETAVNQINTALGGGVSEPVITSKPPAEASVLPEGSTAALELLIKSVHESGARLLVVSAPLPDAYDLPPRVAAVLGFEAVAVLPLGLTLRLPPERFPDGYHLDQTGAIEVTRSVVAYAPHTTQAHDGH